MVNSVALICREVSPAAGAGPAAWAWVRVCVGSGEASQLSGEDTSWKMDLPRDTGPADGGGATATATMQCHVIS